MVGSLVLFLASLVVWVGNRAIGQLDGGQGSTSAHSPVQVPPSVTPPGAGVPPIPGQAGNLRVPGQPANEQTNSPAGFAPYRQVPPPPQSSAAPPILPDRDARDFPVDVGSAQTNDNPTGRQEPAISLEWIGPPTAKLGQPVTYEIVVKNVSSIALHQIAVRLRMPAGFTVQATEPKALAEPSGLSWELGTMQSRQEKRLDLQLLPETKGDLACQALVTFTGSSSARIRVREPKLVVKASGPDKVLLGDVATVSLMVTNPGDGTADQVKIKASLPEGLEHARGRVIEFEVGNLGPNESRSVQLVCATKSGGEQKCDVVALAEGNLKAEDSAVFEVILPRIDLAINGPKLRYLDRKAVYVLKLANPGSAPANNVTVSDQIPEGFKFLSASDGGRHDFATRTVSWFIGDLSPGQAREVSLEVLAINPGEHRHRANVVAARGLKTEAEAITRVEGLSALLMELVDLDDPVEVGADTAYEIRVTNTGTKTETNLQLVCVIPDKMEFRGAQGAANCRFQLRGRELTFEPLPKLAPRADAIFRVNVRGMAPGDLRFRARITADGLTEPVLKEESTKVYGDDTIK
jgi:uncharacterized repeat protein (TIGR01451 family)